jgi:hypothetical protein
MVESAPYDAELRSGSIGPYYPNSSALYASGHIWNDSKGRFLNDTIVTTSKIVEFNESDNIITTASGTRYKLIGMTLHPSIRNLATKQES